MHLSLGNQDERLGGVLEVIVWIFLCFNSVTLSISFYHLYLYYQRRKMPFFQCRMPIATMFVVLYQYVMIFHASVNAFLAIWCQDRHWYSSVFLGLIQLLPMFPLYFYKFG